MPTVTLDGLETYYEVHGLADDGIANNPVLVMGGWGTFTGEDFREIPRGVVSGGGGRTVVVFDWRGLGRSADSPERPADTREPARVAAAVLDAAALEDPSLGTPVHVVGIVGMGACVAQWLAIDRPDLVRSIAVSGGWARSDRVFTDQMEALLDVFVSDGFLAYQRLSALWCFDPDFYAEHAERILGHGGAWKHLDGRPDTMRRLVAATVGHDALDRLGEIAVPAFVLHAGADLLTGPRLTGPIEAAIPGATGELWAELPHVVAGRAAKTRFSDTFDAFLTSVEAT